MRLSSVLILSCLLFSEALASPKPMARRHNDLLRSAEHKIRKVKRAASPVIPSELPVPVVSPVPVRRTLNKRCVARNATISSASSAPKSTNSSIPSSAPAPINVAPAPSIQSSAPAKEPVTTVKNPSSSSSSPPPPPPTHSSPPPPPPPKPSSSSVRPKPSPSPSPPKSSSPPPPPKSSAPPSSPPSSIGGFLGSIISDGVQGSADLTFYTPGLGACGETNSNNDFIVAIGEDLFDGFPGATANPNENPVCNRKVRITYQGKSAVATVTDRCTGCNPESLDLTPNLFEQFASLSAGRLHQASWQWCTDC